MSEDPVKLLEELKELDDFKAVSKLNKDGSYEIDMGCFEHKYEGELGFYHETGFEGHLASILQEDRGLHEDGFHRSLEWAYFIEGGEFLEVYKDKKKVWDGLLVRDYVKSSSEDRKPYFMGLNIDPDDWEKWFSHGSPTYRGVIHTMKPMLAENEDFQKRYKQKNS
ncbi:hypothetical protein N9948_02190 [bacterium]|nr:hypothetical protein [bacterium]